MGNTGPMEDRGGSGSDPAGYAHDGADDEERRDRRVIIIGLVLVIALGAVVWAVVTLMTRDSETNDAIQDPVLDIGSEPPPPPDLTPLPLPSPSPTPAPTPSSTPIPTATAASPPPTPTPSATPQPTVVPQPEPVNQTPGQGVQVRMARASWTGGLFQAAIYHTLLLELGYQVSDPADATYHPADFYRVLAAGDFDFWANGRFPAHTGFFEQLGIESLIQPIGNQISNGGLEGFIVDKVTAEAHGITMLDDIGNNSEVAALFDVDGNGKADLMGCNDGWFCQQVIDDTIARNGWGDTIEQVSANHPELFDSSVERFNRGLPILQHIWTQGPFIAELVPGTDVIWLSVGSPVPSQVGAADLPADQCPGQPCELGFWANDIRVVARNDFLRANPAAAKLFELVAIPIEDISAQSLAYERGADSEFDIRSAALRWIAANRDQVDTWLAAARAAT